MKQKYPRPRNRDHIMPSNASTFIQHQSCDACLITAYELYLLYFAYHKLLNDSYYLYHDVKTSTDLLNLVYLYCWERVGELYLHYSFGLGWCWSLNLFGLLAFGVSQDFLFLFTRIPLFLSLVTFLVFSRFSLKAPFNNSIDS